jgi:hypothetical protein
MKPLLKALGNLLVKWGRALGGGGGPLEPLRATPPPDQRG